MYVCRHIYASVSNESSESTVSSLKSVYAVYVAVYLHILWYLYSVMLHQITMCSPVQLRDDEHLLLWSASL